MEKGVQIFSNNVKIEVDHLTCISRGTLEIIEKTGREVPIEKQEQPDLQLERSSARMANSIIELHLEVPAALEGNVFGQFDEHLKLIERTLNVL